MDFHDAANIFPLDEENIGELAKDIRANGQKMPIELLDGKIIDGRRRLMACNRASVKPAFRDVNPDDPIAYVKSLNLHRRHLTPSQRAACAARAKKMYSEQAKERQKLSKGRGEKGPVNLPDLKGDARDLVGEAFSVSGSLVDRAEKVIEHGVPELVKAVDQGRMSVTSAAQIADMPEDAQRTIAEQSRFSGGRYRKPQIETATPEQPTNGRLKGVGVMRANEAINCLIRIPKNDALRKRGFQIVTDWIKANQ